MKNFKWDKKYLYGGVTAFLVIIACIAFYWIIQRWSGLRTSFSVLLDILSPIIGGFVLAYILTPFVKYFEKKLFQPLGTKIFKKREKSARSFSRGMSIFLALVLVIALASALFSLVIPQVYNSVENIVRNLSSSITKAEKWAEKWLQDYPELETTFTDVVGTAGSRLTQWAKTSLLPQMNDIVSIVSTGVINILKALLNLFVAAVVSVYVMFSREKFGAHSKKVLYSIFSPETVKNIISALKFTDKSFMGFFAGKLVDSLIVGIICYFGCLVIGIKDAVLISVIVAITDIIPFFGPFIGAIPSALIVLMYSPLQCLIFVIFIIVLQQFDGNIIAPKILGITTGLSGFWVLFAIIVGGGLFGFIGMLVGVPTFAVIYAGVKTLVRRKLEKSGLPSETAAYENMSYFDPESLEPVTLTKEKSFKLSEKTDEGSSSSDKTENR